MPEAAMDRPLGKAADPNRKDPLYNTRSYTFARLLEDSENIAPNLVSDIKGFSPTARRIFERFKFADQIEELDASNRLFTIVKAMAEIDLPGCLTLSRGRVDGDRSLGHPARDELRLRVLR